MPRSMSSLAVFLPCFFACSVASAGNLSRYALWGEPEAPPVLPLDQALRASLDPALIRDNGDFRDAPASLFASPVPLRSAAAAPKQPSPVFVKIELRSRPPSGDSSAAELDELIRETGFVPDPRFSMTATDGKFCVWGWMAPSKVGAAARLPSVSRMEIENASSIGSGGEAFARVLLAIRMSPDDLAGAQAAAAIRRLSEQAGFRRRKTIGLEGIPRSGGRALIVSGEVPIRRLGTLLGDPSVVKVMPSPDVQGVPWLRRVRRLPPLPAASPLWRLFLDRYPVLPLLALLLALSWMKRGAGA